MPLSCSVAYCVSGNLHPTEAYLVIPLLEGNMIASKSDNEGNDVVPGVYHYQPEDHSLECRAPIDPKEFTKLFPNVHSKEVPILLGLSSVIWLLKMVILTVIGENLGNMEKEHLDTVNTILVFH